MLNPLNILSEDTFAEKMDVKNSYLAIIADKINLPIDAELSDTSENPVQNKVVKAELDGKLDNSAGSVKGVNLADGCIAWNHIGNGQVTTPAIADNSIDYRKIVNRTISEEKLSDAVVKKLNSGVKWINKITLNETTQGVSSIKITQDSSGNAFSLSNAVITAHLNIDTSQKVGDKYQIRIVANKGRFLFFKSGLAIRQYADVIVNSNYDENTGMTFNVGTYVWTENPNVSTGSSPATNDPSLCNAPDGNAPISEVEVMVIDFGNNQRLPLLSGSFLNIKGE